MNSKTIKILSVGFLVSMLIAVTAFPTANTQPTGIDAGIADMVEANGCSCHGVNPDSGVGITLSGLPNGTFNVSEVYTLTLSITGGPDAMEGGNQGGTQRESRILHIPKMETISGNGHSIGQRLKVIQ